MNIAVRKGYETSTTLAREQERWANLIVNAETDFLKEELFKAHDNKKPVVKKFVLYYIHFGDCKKTRNNNNNNI